MAETTPDRPAIRQTAQQLIANGADKTTIEALYHKTNALKKKEALQIFNRLQQLQKQGLPVDLVANKYNEGLAKRVRLQLIERAGSQLEEKLKQAQRICGPLPESAVKDGRLITTVARQLSYGRTTDTMSRVIGAYAEAGKKDPHAAGVTQVMAGLGALHEMTAAGYSGEEAGNFVSAAVGNNYKGADIERLGRILSLARSEGLADNNSLQQITRERVRFGASALIRSFGMTAGQAENGGNSLRNLGNSNHGGTIPIRPQPAGASANAPAGTSGTGTDDGSDNNGIGHGVTDGGNSSGGNPPTGDTPPGQQ